MELRRFQQFITLAEAGSFTAAAQQLYMAQPSLSASIAALENDMGVQLVTRSRHGITLTDAGRAFLEPARATVTAAGLAKEAAAAGRAKLRPLRIADTFVTADLMPERAAADLHHARPGIDVDIFHFGMRNVTDRVVSGEVDIAITPVNRPLPDVVEAIEMEPIPIGILCPVAHRLAGATGLTVEALEGETFIALPSDSALNDVFQPPDRSPEHGVTRVAVDTWINALSLVRRGYGLTLGPKYATDYYPPDIAMAEFADPPMLEAAIVTPRGTDRHPAVDDYLAAYRSS